MPRLCLSLPLLRLINLSCRCLKVAKMKMEQILKLSCPTMIEMAFPKLMSYLRM